MRNLALLAVTRQCLTLGPDSVISATALDLDDNTIYVASERATDGVVNIDVWKSTRGGLNSSEEVRITRWP